jgi:hypothetical protein
MAKYGKKKSDPIQQGFRSQHRAMFFILLFLLVSIVMPALTREFDLHPIMYGVAALSFVACVMCCSDYLRVAKVLADPARLVRIQPETAPLWMLVAIFSQNVRNSGEPALDYEPVANAEELFGAMIEDTRTSRIWIEVENGIRLCSCLIAYTDSHGDDSEYVCSGIPENKFIADLLGAQHEILIRMGYSS